MNSNISQLSYIINEALQIIENVSRNCSTKNKWDILAHNFLRKNTLTSLSILKIIDPPKVLITGYPNEELKLFDSNSAFVLIRTLFETYVNMYYLLLDVDSEDEKQLRYLLWDRHYRVERRKMAHYRELIDPKLEREALEIEKLNFEINENAHFKKLPVKKRNKFLQKEWNWDVYDKFEEKAEKTIIHKGRISYLYKFLSNYAHSESYALMQVSSIKDQNESQLLIEGMPLIYTQALLSLTIDNYINSFNGVQEIITVSDELTKNIKYWKEWIVKPK